jgi:hypothetical protein
MASTYSNLKFELIGTGDQSGTWGITTNTNLGTAIEQALVGMATISSGFTGSPLTLSLTLTDTNAAQNARALCLNLTQSLASAGTLNVPAIEKPYMIINATGQTVTVKVSGLTGVAVPTGKRAFVYNNGTDVGEFVNYLSSLSLGTDLAVADGGTGLSSGTSGGILYFSGTTTLASSGALAANALVIGGGAGVAPSTTTTGTGVVTAVGNAVNTTGGIVTQSGTLAASSLLVGGGASTAISSTTTGTGVVTAVGNAVNTTGGLVTQSGTLASSALLLGGGASTAISSTTTGTGVVTALGNATNAANGVPVLNASGLLAIAQGGTNSSATATAGGVGYGTGTAHAYTSAGTAGYVLQSNGSSAPTWVAPSTGTVTAVSVATSNGFAGSSSGGATPALTLSTTITGVLKGNGTAISAATAGTDYLAPPSGTSILKANSGGALANATAGTDYVAPGTATTFTALQTFSGSSTSAATKLTNAKEVATVSATAATGTITYNVTTQSVLYYTSNASANWTVNFTVSWNGSTGTKLDTIMSTGESMTVAFLVTQGATAYYNSALQIDGSSVTPKWQGGTAPTSGNASSIDSYVYTIVKTGSATFTVFASQTKFA